MNRLLLLLLLVAPLGAWAQTEAPATTANFCGVNLELPAGCTAASKYSVQCQDYQLTWMYLDFSYLKTFPEQFVRQIEKKHKGTERQPLECFILDQPAQGFRLSYPTENGGMSYELIAYGTAKGQPVMVELIMPTDPEKSADLPAMAQQIIRLPK